MACQLGKVCPLYCHIGPYLRLTWSSNMRQPTYNKCHQWYFMINGKECTSPAPINANVYHAIGRGHQNNGLRHSTVVGVCQATSSGSFKCASYQISVLRETAPVIASSLTHIYNLSLTTATFPSDWKRAIVCPIFKNRGEKSDPSNYRPISLLPAVGKVFDKLQSHSLCQFLMKNGLISDQQFGFLPGRSTLTQFLSVTDEWARAIDRGERVAAVFLDFYKAFDRVWHDGLLHKLGKCGLHPSALAWLQNHLSDRSLSVRVCNATSNPITITAGVPQGSHLGPILFVVFINDLPSSVSSRTLLYADDALEYEIGAPPSTISLQRSIDHTTQWAACWHGKFSSCKTELLMVGRQTSADDQVTISIYSSVIAECSSHKHLGVTISSNLNWSAHITQVIKKASRRCGLLRCMSHHLPPTISSLLYIYHVRPIFEYASPLWHGAISAELALSLEKLQASVARAILRAPWRTPKQQLLEALNWPSLRWRRAVASTCLFQQLIHAPNTLPSLSKHLFPLLSSRSTRNRRKPFQIALPKVRTTRYQHSFFFHTALLWNSLPQSIQATKPPQQFRIALEQLWHKYKHNPTTDIPLPFWIYQQHTEIPQIRALQLCWEILYILNNK